MFFIGAPGAPAPSFEGHTLVLPAVSHGNVGQLALDLLVNTLLAQTALERVGYLNSSNVLAVAGNATWSTLGGLSVGMEVFSDATAKLTLVQLRAPPADGRTAAFAAELAAWVGGAGFEKTLLLGGSQPSPLVDTITQQAPRYACTASAGGAAGGAAALAAEVPLAAALAALEESGCRALEGQAAGAALLSEAVRFGGLARPLFRAMGAAALPLVVLVRFCSEGDNTQEGAQLATVANGFCGSPLAPQLPPGMEEGAIPEQLKHLPAAMLRRVQWVEPPSWAGLHMGEHEMDAFTFQ